MHRQIGLRLLYLVKVVLYVAGTTKENRTSDRSRGTIDLKHMFNKPEW